MSYTVLQIDVVGGSSMTIYHFVGIKGSGMSALAQVLHDMKFKVQGSDVEKRFLHNWPLSNQGLPFFLSKRRISSQE